MNLERFTDRKRKDEDLAQEIDSHLAHEQMPMPREASLQRKLAVRPT
jgi:hypothetical protein